VGETALLALSDRQIDEVVSFLKDSGLADEIVKENGFDWHSRLVSRALAHGGLKAFLRVVGILPSARPPQA